MNLFDLPQLPAWATDPEAQAFYYGFFFGAVIRIVRSLMRFIKRSDGDRYGDS